MEFSSSLTHWYLRHRRNLPWRATRDPYSIWLSEVILQQTRVAQGLPYYESFKTLFPTVLDLANAGEQEVMLAWQGLGYYSRARNLHAAAKVVAIDLDGTFPNNYHDLLKLPGIGEYTAAAIASFAYGEPTPVVDGNVFRVLSRIFGIGSDIAKPSARKEFTALARGLMGEFDPAEFNQAIMEFGALQCTPKSPDCQACPFNDKCIALATGQIGKLPFKSTKAKPVDRFLHYFVVEDPAGRTIVNKRTGPGIWNQLYEFPVMETQGPASDTQMLAEASARYGNVELRALGHCDVLHKLSHQNLHIRFAKVSITGPAEGSVMPSELHSLPFPAVLHKFIEKHWN